MKCSEVPTDDEPQMSGACSREASLCVSGLRSGWRARAGAKSGGALDEAFAFGERCAERGYEQPWRMLVPRRIGHMAELYAMVAVRGMLRERAGRIVRMRRLRDRVQRKAHGKRHEHGAQPTGGMTQSVEHRGAKASPDGGIL
jgi:hypothetical protein